MLLGYYGYCDFVKEEIDQTSSTHYHEKLIQNFVETQG
jgi:hypothetical protein